MHASSLPPVAKPDHVPEQLVRDFDFFAPEGAEDDVQLAWKRLQDGPDFVWTPRNGGHWIATRGEDIKEIQTNNARFSHRVFTLPADPQAPHVPLPLGLDPPAHAPYRKLIMPAVLPNVVNAVEASVRELAIELIEGFAPKGECEFIADFAKQLPIAVFMKIVDLPFEDREILLPWAEVVVRSSDQAARREAQQNMMGYLSKWVEERKVKPGADLISSVVHGKVGERTISDEEIYSLLTLVLFGGLDTVASMLGFVGRFLAMNPQARREIIAHPELSRNVVEELIRRHGLSNTARYITEDFESKGVAFKAGDLIQVPNSLYGLDESINPDPLTVDFTRESIKHAAFGNGPHTCPGAVLARREIAVFLDEWLARIPEFQIKPGTRPQMASGHVNGVTKLELVWDPATTRA